MARERTPSNAKSLVLERVTFEREEWFVEALDNGSVSERATEIILNRFERPGVFQLIKLLC